MKNLLMILMTSMIVGGTANANEILCQAFLADGVTRAQNFDLHVALLGLEKRTGVWGATQSAATSINGQTFYSTYTKRSIPLHVPGNSLQISSQIGEMKIGISGYDRPQGIDYTHGGLEFSSQSPFSKQTFLLECSYRPGFQSQF